MSIQDDLRAVRERRAEAALDYQRRPSKKMWGDSGKYLVLFRAEDGSYGVRLENRPEGISREIVPPVPNPTREDWIRMREAFTEAIEKEKPDFAMDVIWPDQLFPTHPKETISP